MTQALLDAVKIAPDYLKHHAPMLYVLERLLYDSIYRFAK